jgi:ribose 5-phosphate isomerase B
MKKILIASDHGGFALKQELVGVLREQGVTPPGGQPVSCAVTDLGVEAAQSVDYPKYAASLARRVAEDPSVLGVLICGTGQGMAMSANKVAGVRAAVCADVYSARMARRHNNANVLCLGGRVLGVELARAIMDVFLTESFEGGRHARRVALMQRIEEGDFASLAP